MDEIIAKVPGESDASVQQRLSEAQAKSEPVEPVNSETTAHPSGVPAHLVFPSRIASALFTLRNHGYTEVEALIGDLYAGVQKLESKFRSAKPSDV